MRILDVSDLSRKPSNPKGYMNPISPSLQEILDNAPLSPKEKEMLSYHWSSQEEEQEVAKKPSKAMEIFKQLITPAEIVIFTASTYSATAAYLSGIILWFIWIGTLGIFPAFIIIGCIMNLKKRKAGNHKFMFRPVFIAALAKKSRLKMAYALVMTAALYASIGIAGHIPTAIWLTVTLCAVRIASVRLRKILLEDIRYETERHDFLDDQTRLIDVVVLPRIGAR